MTKDGVLTQTIEVEAFTYGNPPLFAVHPRLNENGPILLTEDWEVTHIATGARLPGPALYKSFKQMKARKLAKLLAEKPELWEFTEPPKNGDPKGEAAIAFFKEVMAQVRGF